jgi:hypothetical protein
LLNVTRLEIGKTFSICFVTSEMASIDKNCLIIPLAGGTLRVVKTPLTLSFDATVDV